MCPVPAQVRGRVHRSNFIFFKEERIDQYATLQTQIASNTIEYLKTGGRIIYITCSVFKKENEDVVNELIKQFSLRAISMELINGVQRKADSMFVAVLKK